MVQISKNMDIISRLRKEILSWEGYKAPVSSRSTEFGLGPIEAVFPNQIFPTGVIHEFLCAETEHAAASGGFISGLLKVLMQTGGACVWISTSRTIYPPALKAFGIDPERVIFIDLRLEKEILWVMEESLKCKGLAAVIAEIRDISFAQSRRLQLAVEKSQVTGFVLRNDPEKLSSTACASRWRIQSLPSQLEPGMPGVGFPRWNVELLKVRNGNPGKWQVEWSTNQFKILPAEHVSLENHNQRKAG